MKLKMFSVYDSKTQAYLPPIYLQSAGAAIRALETAANDPSHEFSKYASDFTMFEIGSFDDESGTVSMLNAKISLGTALEFKKV